MTDTRKNKIRTQFYTEFRKYFQYETYEFNKNKDSSNVTMNNGSKNFLLPEPLNLPYPENIIENINDRGNIERSFDFDFVKPNLINPLQSFMSSDIFFHNYMILSKKAFDNSYTFLKTLLFVHSSLLNSINIEILQNPMKKYFINLPNFSNKNLMKDLSSYIYINYEAKHIDGIIINGDFAKFKDLKQFESLNKLNDTEKLLYFLYNNGYFNYYNHIIDVVSNCSIINENQYYCNRLKIGAVKVLEFYLLTESLLNFIKDLKPITEKDQSKLILNGTIYKDVIYDCKSKFMSQDLKSSWSSKNLLKQDIIQYYNMISNLTSKINIETDLINQKFFNVLNKSKKIELNENIIKDLDIDKKRSSNIIITLEEKNDIAKKKFYKNRNIMFLIGLIVILYIIINMLILVKYIEFDSYNLLIINVTILIILLLYIFINKVKNIIS
jgi:hypothetical protein